MNAIPPLTTIAAPTRQPFHHAAIIVLAAVVTLVDAVWGSLSLRKLSIGLAMLLLGIECLMEPRWPVPVMWMRRVGAVLAVGYFVLWALE